MVGTECGNIDTIPRLYLCTACKLLLKEPCQLNCGHRQCQSCIDEVQEESITCPECREIVKKDEIMPDRGVKNDMKGLILSCCRCQWTGTYQNYEKHRQQEHANSCCRFCSCQVNTVDHLEAHERQCPKAEISCPLKDFECCEKIVREELATHYLTFTHQRAIMNFVQFLMSKLKPEKTERSASMEMDTEHTTASDVSEPVQDVHESLSMIANGIRTLQEDVKRLSTENIHLKSIIETLKQDIVSVKSSVQEQGSSIDGLRPNHDVLQQEVSSLKQKIDDAQNVSYDGTLIWKISNVREKMMDAQSERQTSIYSPPFYSSPTGYKMRARLYLHGDGNARRTHMSLFFVLMRGPNDAVLRFPFNYKVTFCLYDQTAQQRHIIDSFRPDTKSNSFQRPRSEMNIASGIPKFCPLQHIQSEDSPYVHEDTMFIKVMVDFADMPKLVLPYALSLNPGLPTHVQQVMVKAETEKRTPSNTTALKLTMPEIGSTQNPKLQ